jgi:hypothetical protein
VLLHVEWKVGTDIFKVRVAILFSVRQSKVDLRYSFGLLDIEVKDTTSLRNVCNHLPVSRTSGVPRNFVREGFNKFS